MPRWYQKPFIFERGLFQYMRVGKIVQTKRLEKSQDTGKVAIQWLDLAGGKEDLWLTFPQLGDGWGIHSLPEERSVVLIGFYQSGFPIILGYLPLDYEDMVRDTAKEGTFWRLRKVVPGEVSIKSKQQAEVYLDKDGSLQLIVRDQAQDTCEEYIHKDARGRIYKTYMPKESLVTLKFDTTGSDTVNLTTKSGTIIKIDMDGNIEVDAPGKVEVNATGEVDINGSIVRLNGGTAGIHTSSNHPNCIFAGTPFLGSDKEKAT